jgi:hypothetical protein
MVSFQELFYSLFTINPIFFTNSLLVRGLFKNHKNIVNTAVSTAYSSLRDFYRIVGFSSSSQQGGRELESEIGGELLLDWGQVQKSRLRWRRDAIWPITDEEL